jgi:hypothetical protein
MLTLLLLAQAQSVNPILNRFEQFVKNADTLAVSYSVKIGGKPYGTMDLKIDRPNRLKAVLKTKEGNLVYVINEGGAMEINHPAQMYAVHPPIGRLFLPPLKVVEPMTYTISQALVTGFKEAIAQPNGKPTVTSNAMVGNVATDEIYTRTSGMGGDTQMKSNIDSQGRLMRYWVKSAGPGGSVEIELVMGNYVVGKPIPASVFSTALPLGYSPYGLARADFGLPQGSPVPNVRLKSVSGGGSVTLKSLLGGKPTMVVLTDPEFPDNVAMLRSTRELIKQIPNSRLVVVGMRKDAASAKAVGGPNAYFDPTGMDIQLLAAPGAPTFYLFRSNGTLAQMLFGFDGKWDEFDQALKLLKKQG